MLVPAPLEVLGQVLRARKGHRVRAVPDVDLHALHVGRVVQDARILLLVVGDAVRVQPVAREADVVELPDVRNPGVRQDVGVREPAKRAALRGREHPVVLLDVRHDVLEQEFREQRVVGVAPIRRHRRIQRPDARHHHDHRLRLALGDQVVENQVRPADRDPSPVVVTSAVQQVHDRIPGLARCHSRAGRRCASGARRRRQPTGSGRCARRRAARGAASRSAGLLARDEEHALRAADAGLDEAVHRVWNGGPVHAEGVAVEIRRERTEGDRPHALVVLHQLLSPRLHEPEVTGDRHVPGIRRPEAEGDAPVRQDLGRHDGGRLGGRGLRRRRPAFPALRRGPPASAALASGGFVACLIPVPQPHLNPAAFERLAHHAEIGPAAVIRIHDLRLDDAGGGGRFLRGHREGEIHRQKRRFDILQGRHLRDVLRVAGDVEPLVPEGQHVSVSVALRMIRSPGSGCRREPLRHASGQPACSRRCGSPSCPAGPSQPPPARGRRCLPSSLSPPRRRPCDRRACGR